MGNNVVVFLMVILTITAVGGVLYMTDGFGMFKGTAVDQTKVEIVKESKSGTITTFKLAVEDNGDSPARYAGTGYCWDVSKPSELISGGSVTLSASAGTTISPITVGQTITCVAFDSTHYGLPETKTVAGEGEEMMLSSLNATSSMSSGQFKFYEDNIAENESGANLDIAASATDSYDKLMVKVDVADAGYNFKEICFGSNATSSSQINNIEVDGMTKVEVPYAYRNTHDYCYAMASAQYVEDFNELTTGKIKVSMTASHSATERVNVTLLDEAYFKSVDGSIKKGIQTDAPAPTSTGVVGDISTYFTIT